MPLIRLQKFLAEAGACSRRKGEVHIRSGHVAVNGQVVTTLGTKVDPDSDTVHLNGQPVVRSERLIYVMLNKPQRGGDQLPSPGESRWSRTWWICPSAWFRWAGWTRTPPGCCC